MLNAPFAFAFTAGLIAVVNPCGFAMLPAYLSYFMGIEGQAEDGDDPRSSLTRALVTGATVSLGFFVVFGVVGALFTLGLSSIEDQLPWAGLIIGVVMFCLGIAMWNGFRITVGIPKLEKGGSGRDFRSLFLFGISYAIASLSCAFPTFFALFGLVNGFSSGATVFAAYSAGMTTILIALTVSLAMARQSLLRTLRKAMQHVDKASAALLMVAGGYIVYFWVVDLANVGSASRWRGPLLFIEQISGNARNWVRDTGGARVGLLLGSVIALAVAAVLLWPANKADSASNGTSSSPAADKQPVS
ncbi:MAG: cytochrome c biogenesis protein CcdA [Actinobacteria bacterium]|nr:cytochrome c biogenesis protein CcdA [Actinomycetota bacterium]